VRDLLPCPAQHLLADELGDLDRLGLVGALALGEVERPLGQRRDEVLDQLTDVAGWSMTAAEQRSALVALRRGQSRIEELRLRVLAAGDRADIAAESATTSTAVWVAHETRQTRGAAHADVRLALALDDTFAATRDSLAAGAVDGDQARVIVRAVQALPASVVASDPDLSAQAEKHLLVLAETHDAKQLKIAGRYICEVLDPEAADTALGEKLDAEERAAARRLFLELHDNGDGTHTGRFKVGTLHAAMLTKALEAFTNPHHRHSVRDELTSAENGTTPRSPRPELLGQAFCELIERLDPATLPHSGGMNATVVVTLDYDQLLAGLGSAQLDTGQRISAGAARRLACEVGVIPAVLRRRVDGRSVVLDLGRRRRLHTEAQRIALAIEQGGCTTEGCDRPPAWTQAHHDIPWSVGGGTTVRDGRLLCPFHHGKAHSPAYDMHRLPDGRVRFHRRT